MDREFRVCQGPIGVNRTDSGMYIHKGDWYNPCRGLCWVYIWSILTYKAPPLWPNSGRRRQFRVTIGCLVAGSIPGCVYVKEIPLVEHKTTECYGL